jgi:hypothetical protein
MEAKKLVVDDAGPASAVTPVANKVLNVSSVVEATLPLQLSAKWVACACRMAGVAKPRWDRHTSIWSTSATREDGATETITIAQGNTPRNVVIEVTWVASEGSTHATATGRRLVTSFFTGMLWSVRHKTRAQVEPV